VVGRPDETRGEVISVFVLLKHGFTASAELKLALLETIRHELGPVAVIGELNFVSMLQRREAARSCAACSRRSFSIAILATSRPSKTKGQSMKRVMRGSR